MADSPRDEPSAVAEMDWARLGFESGIVGMMLAAPSGKLVRANRALCRFLGRPQRELEAGSWLDVIHPDDVGPLAALMEQAVRGEIPSFQREVRYEHAEGQTVWALVSATLVRDPSGRPVCFVAQVLDLTDRKRTEEAVRASEERLVEAQALARFGSWYWDVIADTVTWSDELYRIFGLEPGLPITYAMFLERVHPEDRDRIDGLVRGALRTHAPYWYESRIVRPSGEVRWLRGGGRVIADGSGRVQAVHGTCQDVTEQANVERELREAVARAEDVAARLRASDEAKNALLAVVSHELRTPLANVLGLAETLHERCADLAPDVVARMAERIAVGTRRLQHLLDDMLDLDRLTREGFEPSRTPTKLRPLVEHVVATAEVKRPVHIDVPDIVASVDGAQVERMLDNLIRNAVAHGGPDVTIWIGVRQESDGVVIVVSDDGPGVPLHLREAIFEPFRRGDAAGPGSGIGLALVARYAALHSGEAWIEDRPGGGASFHVRLRT